MAKFPYNLWSVRGKRIARRVALGRYEKREQSPIFLIGLGTKKDCQGRWRYLTQDEAHMPIQLWQHVKLWLPSAKSYRIILYQGFETRAEAEAIMLNIRAQNRLTIVEDWT